MTIKKTSLFVLIIFTFFMISSVAMAQWTPPPGTPPTCPVSEPGCNIPINVSSATQWKTGTLLIDPGRFIVGPHASPTFFVDPATKQLGIRTNSPTQALDIDGQVRIRGGVPGANKVLASDDTGVGSWKSLSEIIDSIGVSKIIPGTNVTISPESGTGEVTINAAGGPGGSIEISNAPSGGLDFSPSKIISTGTIGIATGGVTSTKIASNAVTGVKIASQAVTSTKISGNGSTSGQVLVSTGPTTSPTWQDVDTTTTAGVAKIKAGNNITISPTGGTGEVTINATGGNVNLTNANNGGLILNPSTITGTGTIGITDGGVTTSKIADSSVTNSKIADQTITLAKLFRTGTAGQVLTSQGTGASPTWETVSAGGMSNPMTTRGDIIYGTTNGNAARLAPGTSGQVLTTQGSGYDPVWVTPNSDSSGGFSEFRYINEYEDGPNGLIKGGSWKVCMITGVEGRRSGSVVFGVAQALLGWNAATAIITANAYTADSPLCKVSPESKTSETLGNNQTWKISSNNASCSAICMR